MAAHVARADLDRRRDSPTTRVRRRSSPTGATVGPDRSAGAATRAWNDRPAGPVVRIRRRSMEPDSGVGQTAVVTPSRHRFARCSHATDAFGCADLPTLMSSNRHRNSFGYVVFSLDAHVCRERKMGLVFDGSGFCDRGAEVGFPLQGSRLRVCGLPRFPGSAPRPEQPNRATPLSRARVLHCCGESADTG